MVQERRQQVHLGLQKERKTPTPGPQPTPQSQNTIPHHTAMWATALPRRALSWARPGARRCNPEGMRLSVSESNGADASKTYQPTNQSVAILCDQPSAQISTPLQFPATTNRGCMHGSPNGIDCCHSDFYTHARGSRWRMINSANNTSCDVKMTS